MGKLQPSSDSQQLSQNVVVFRARQGDLLVALDVHGVVKLEKSVPTVWVTVPTKQKCDVSFIVNGRFDLDVGAFAIGIRFTEQQGCCRQYWTGNRGFTD